MAGDFQVGDRVQWNSEAGLVSVTTIRIHTGDFDFKGTGTMRARIRRNDEIRAARPTTSQRTRGRR